MDCRERVLTCFDHREPDRVPRRASLTAAVLDACRERLGIDDPAAHWGWDIRDVRMLPPDPAPDLHERFRPYLAALDGEWTLSWDQAYYGPEWGVPERPSHLYHLSMPVPPLQSASLDDVRDYPLPDYVGEWRHDHLEREIAALQKEGYAVNAHLGWIFQTAWTLRSEEQLFDDFYTSPDLANLLLDRITEIRVAQVERYARAGVDLLALNDDIGSQRGMIVSPRMWRRWLKPRLAQVIASAKRVRPSIKFRYHSDGVYMPVIPELIEIGVDSLITVQQEVMDAVAIKHEFGQDVVLEGTIGLQSDLAQGTPDAIHGLVKRQCEALMAGGGWLASPGNDITPDIPVENLDAMFAALDALGAYR